MNTNLQMLKELLNIYHPRETGVVWSDECWVIVDTLHLAEMDVLQLRNMRDLVVIFLGQKQDIESWDKMRAITEVIDSIIFNLGGEV